MGLLGVNQLPDASKPFFSIGKCMALARSGLQSFLSCFVELRQRGRFAGFSLYLSNNGDIQGSTLCYKDYKDEPQLPPLNLTTRTWACMAVSVTKLVQETLKRQCVMYKTEPVLPVIVDGQETHVTIV